MADDFSFRIRLNEYEVELKGTRDEVLKTIEELPRLMKNIHGGLQAIKPKTVATLTVRTEPTEDRKPIEKYPKVSPTQNCDEAITKMLQTDWGKWRPRTIKELKSAMAANGFGFSGRTLAGTLQGLVRKKRVRRWKTDAGFVYILAEQESPRPRSEVE